MHIDSDGEVEHHPAAAAAANAEHGLPSTPKHR